MIFKWKEKRSFVERDCNIGRMGFMDGGKRLEGVDRFYLVKKMCVGIYVL